MSKRDPQSKGYFTWRSVYANWIIMLIGTIQRNWKRRDVGLGSRLYTPPFSVYLVNVARLDLKSEVIFGDLRKKPYLCTCKALQNEVFPQFCYRVVTSSLYRRALHIHNQRFIDFTSHSALESRTWKQERTYMNTTAYSVENQWFAEAKPLF